MPAHDDDRVTDYHRDLAEALGLLVLTDAFRVERVRLLRLAEDDLGRALDSLFDARDSLDEATTLQVEAMKLVSMRRDGSAEYIESLFAPHA